jgi:hypothetical protein
MSGWADRARARLATKVATLRCEARFISEAFRVMLDLGGPFGILIYKLDGSLPRRVRESAERNPTWRQAVSRRREAP